MKLFFILLMSISTSLFTFSQEIDSRLLNRYTLEDLVEMNNSNNQEYKLLVYALDNAVYLTNLPELKNIDLESIDISNKDLNIISLGIDIKDKNQYFKVLGDNKMLVVKSRYVLNEELK